MIVVLGRWPESDGDRPAKHQPMGIVGTLWTPRAVQRQNIGLHVVPYAPNHHQPKTLSLIWLKNNLLPSDWDEQHQLFDEFDA